MPKNQNVILASTGTLAKTIREVLAPGNGRRVVIVAFVGDDALQFVGGGAAAKGMEIYCWDNPTSTSPRGLRNLLRAEAKIFFVSDLHMKVYWAQRGGYVIGSPNLSAAALDDERNRNQLEAAVFDSDAEAFPLEDVMRRLRARGVRPVKSQADIDEFARRCKKQVKRAARGAGSALKADTSFDKYLKKGGPAFSYIAYVDTEDLSRRDLEAAANAHYRAYHTKEEPRKSLVKDAQIVTSGKHHKDWILTFYCGGPKRVGALEWLYVHAEAPSREGTKTKMQVRGLAIPDNAPFDLKSSDFKRRFTAYMRSRYPDDVGYAEDPFNKNDFARFEASLRG
jgi:hypothetical protein